jgi:predicted Zn-dependent peptidase
VGFASHLQQFSIPSFNPIISVSDDMHILNRLIVMFNPSARSSSSFISTLSRLSRAIALFVIIALLSWVLPSSGAFARTYASRTQSPSPDTVQQPASSIQPYIDGVINQITEFTLDNGMKFIVMERHQAPVVSFMTYVDVGASNEEDGKTGVAHYLEHMVFKGTPRIGTKDYEAERPLLDRLEDLYSQIQAAEAAGQDDEVELLQAEFEQVNAEANQYVIQNQYPQIIEQEGGVGLNATTGADATRYFYSLPSNKLELWMSLESERFLEPVLREFFEEKEVVLEERRMRADNSPIGLMIERFLETAFEANPYARPVIGYEEDIRNLAPSDLREFFETYYGPQTMTAAVVGDVNPDEVRRLAEIYFGRFPSQPSVPPISFDEPPQTETREVTLRFQSQPWYLEGYHRPGINHPDHVVYELLSAVLSNGRTSRLYQSLVEEQQIALTAQSLNGFPGDRLDNLVLFYALTAPDHTVDEVADALNTEIERLKTEPITPDELDRVKTQARAGLLRTLSSNQGMASLLPEYEAKTGSWRNLFDQLKAIDTVTIDDIQRVAQTTFRPENRTVGRLLPIEENAGN